MVVGALGIRSSVLGWARRWFNDSQTQISSLDDVFGKFEERKKK